MGLHGPSRQDPELLAQSVFKQSKKL